MDCNPLQYLSNNSDVHEVIQPVIQKETIQPSVIHTTVPIHEVHNNEAKFEKKTTLPTMSMQEFKKSSASVHGTEHRKDSFDGEPKGLGKLVSPKNNLGTIGGPGADGTTSMTGDLDSHVGPSRGSMPATSARGHVSAHNKDVVAGSERDTSLPHQNERSKVAPGTTANTATNGTTDTSHSTTSPTSESKAARYVDRETRGDASGTMPESPTYSTNRASGSTTSKLDPRVDRVDNNSAHIIPRSEASRAKELEATSSSKHDDEKSGLLTKIKNVLH